MPSITINTDVGKTLEQNRGLVKDMTEAVCKNLNVPPQAVSIHIVEGTKENRAKGGILASD